MYEVGIFSLDNLRKIIRDDGVSQLLEIDKLKY